MRNACLSVIKENPLLSESAFVAGGSLTETLSEPEVDLGLDRKGACSIPVLIKNMDAIASGKCTES